MISYQVIIQVETNDRRDNGENSNKTKRIITSLRKSPCFLSSASIALSKIPPDVALVKERKKKVQFTIHSILIILTDEPQRYLYQIVYYASWICHIMATK